MLRIRSLIFGLCTAISATASTGCYTAIAPQQTYYQPHAWNFLRTPSQQTITTPNQQAIGPSSWLWFNVDGGSTAPLSAAELMIGVEGVCVAAPFSPWLGVAAVTVDDVDPRLWLGLQLTGNEQQTLTATVTGPTSLRVAGPSADVRAWLFAARRRIEPMVRNTLGLRPGVLQFFAGTEISSPMTIWRGLETLATGGMIGWRWEEIHAVSVYVPPPQTYDVPPRNQAAAWRGNKLPTHPCPVQSLQSLLATEPA